MLPFRTTIEDIEAVCGYLATKPTGALLAEARAVVDRKHLDSRKLGALKIWGLIDESEDKIKITEMGRRFVRDSGAFRSDVLREVVRRIGPYRATVERIVHRNERVLAATDLSAYWYEHFKPDVSESEKVLNEQAICFFQIAQGADLGALFYGRRGLSTRFEFESDATNKFVSELVENISDRSSAFPVSAENEFVKSDDAEDQISVLRDHKPVEPARGNRVFITHGKNLKILDQVKQIVMYGKFEPVVAMEHETLAKPVPQKVMDEMRTCDAAVINVTTEQLLLDGDGNEVQKINENVLIEIGAAMALYGDRFILLVEEGVMLPSNLQGLYECRYQGSELNMPATMKLLEAFNEFGND